MTTRVVHRIQQRLGADGTGDGLNIKRKTRHLNRLRAGPRAVRCVSVYYDGGGRLTPSCGPLRSVLATNPLRRKPVQQCNAAVTAGVL